MIESIRRNPEGRQEAILSRLRAMPRAWRVKELAAAMRVSVVTIRRDLDELARRGAILRTQGGCLYAGRAALESAYLERVALNFDLKRAIGRRALDEVSRGDVLLLNDGSTTFHLASGLAARAPLTVYTNSIAMIAELGPCEKVRLFLLGGEYDRDLFFLRGGLTERTLQALDFDAVFVGTDAIDAQGRCMVAEPQSARVAEAMLRRARRKVLLADPTKVGARTGYVGYATLKDFDLWITTPGVKAGTLRKFRRWTTVEEAAV